MYSCGGFFGSCHGVCCGDVSQQSDGKADCEFRDGLVRVVCGVADGDAAGFALRGVDVIDAGEGYVDHFEVAGLPDRFCGIRGVCDDDNVGVAGSFSEFLRVGCPGRVRGKPVSGTDEVCGEFLYAGVGDTDGFKENDVHGMVREYWIGFRFLYTDA